MKLFLPSSMIERHLQSLVAGSVEQNQMQILGSQN